MLRRGGIERVDFLSLDVEGHELAVLQGIDWERTRGDGINVELTHWFEDLEKLLERRGYVRHFVGKESEISPVGKGFLGMGCIFVRRDVRLGKPD
ncbi:S-adenosyl-L-methionine-dependent methyltransferase [Gracilaria domingensis]|nr:S-adenosyl-L-methionine-dependent methyltransferase [Gracilaria domingensis]